MNVGKLVKALQPIVGREYVIHHPEDLLVFEYDGSIDRGLPQVVVFPTTTEQVSQVVALAYREGVPVVARGAGTGLSGGAIAALGGIQVALSRMNRILEVDPANRLAVAQPGVINLQLDLAVRRHGLRYTPDPSSQRACSLGGNIAENAGGPHCLAYGVTTNHVTGLEVVLEDGSVAWLGGRVPDAPGYDLRGVFIGSEGTFGIATKIVAWLLPLPEAVKTMLAIFPDVDSASAAVSGIIAKGMVPAALEMLDAMAIRAVQGAMDAGYPEDAGAVLLVEVEGLREEVAEQAQEVEAVLADHGAREVRAAEEAAERERLWVGRKGALGALGFLAPNYYLVDGVVPRSRLPGVLRQVAEIGQKYGMPIANVFHAGDGNLHPCILFDERRPGEMERVTKAGGEILKVCIEEGGALSGEHGVGLEKQAYMPWVFTPEDMEVMQQVRRAFSPRELFNPGKVFPGGPGYQEATQRAAVARAGGDAYI
ncbi:MAG: FAD-binding oxidoreductase [Dehalococcoidia bacterium]